MRKIRLKRVTAAIMAVLMVVGLMTTNGVTTMAAPAPENGASAETAFIVNTAADLKDKLDDGVAGDDAVYIKLGADISIARGQLLASGAPKVLILNGCNITGTEVVNTNVVDPGATDNVNLQDNAVITVAAGASLDITEVADKRTEAEAGTISVNDISDGKGTGITVLEGGTCTVTYANIKGVNQVFWLKGNNNANRTNLKIIQGNITAASIDVDKRQQSEIIAVDYSCHANVEIAGELDQAPHFTFYNDKFLFRSGSETDVTCAIKNGVYSFNNELNNKGYVPAGYTCEAVDPDDTTKGYVVRKGFYVDASGAATGATGTKANPYPTLKAALTAGNGIDYTGDPTKSYSIYVMSDIVKDFLYSANGEAELNVYTKDKAVTIVGLNKADGNKVKIIDSNSYSPTYASWMLSHDATVDSSLTLKNIIVDGGARTAADHGSFFVENGNTLTLGKGAEIINYKPGAVIVRAGGELVMEPGAEIKNCIAGVTGAYPEYAANGVTLSNYNPVDYAGGAVYVDPQGKATFLGGEITGNSGNAVYVAKDAKVYISGNTKISGNSTSSGATAAGLTPNIFLEKGATIVAGIEGQEDNAAYDLGTSAELHVGTVVPAVYEPVTVFTNATETDMRKLTLDSVGELSMDGTNIVIQNGAEWTNPGGEIERNPLYVYNKALSTMSGYNEKVIELNAANNAKNVLSKVLSTTPGTKYRYTFEYTNRTSARTTDDENTFSLWALPGIVNDKDTLAAPETVSGAVRLGTYHGSDLTWVEADGEFSGLGTNTTLVFVPKKQSGLGGIIKDNITIGTGYALNQAQVNDSSNRISNGTFGDDTTPIWANTNGGVEIGQYTSYTNSHVNETKVMEINGDLPSGSQRYAAYQQINTADLAHLSSGEITVAFDYIVRTKGAATNPKSETIDVYIVKVEDVQDFASKGKRIATVYGARELWQTATGTFAVNGAFKDTDDIAVVFSTQYGGAGVGGVIDNVSVTTKLLPVQVLDKTDTTATLVTLPGATKYVMTNNADPSDVHESVDDATVEELTPGATYTVEVYSQAGVLLGKNENVTTKAATPAAPSDAVTVANKTTTSIKIIPESGHEYSIDGGVTWIKEGEFDGVFDGLDPNKEYKIWERLSATYDTAASLHKETAVTTKKPASQVDAPQQAPTLIDRTDTSLTVKGGADEEFSLDGVTWKPGPTATFTGLTKGTEYEVLSRKKATDDAEAGQELKTKFKTAIQATGKVTGTDLPATVQLTNTKTGEKFTVTTDASGNWSVYVDAGDYDIQVNGKTGQEATKDKLTVKPNGTNASVTTMQPVHTEPNAPTLKDRTETSLTVTGEEGVEFSLDGTNWIAGPTATFTGLKKGTAYTVYSRFAATDKLDAGKAIATEFKTGIETTGKVEGTDLPANVELKEPETDETLFSTQTDNKGNWTIYADAGEYNVLITGKDGKEISRGKITVSLDGTNTLNSTMKAVKTGDNMHVELYMMLLLLGIAAAGVATKKRTHRI